MKKKKKKGLSERVIQKGILDLLKMIKDRGAPIYAIRTASGSVTTDTGRRFSTGRAGCPDITVCVNGLFVGLEVKTKTGRQSELQKKAQAEIERANGFYYIVRSNKDVEVALSYHIDVEFYLGQGMEK